MNVKGIILGVIILVVLIVLAFNIPQISVGEEISFTNISASELKQDLVDKDFFLLDVHIPEQEHIMGTDAFIPYNELELHLDEIPSDRSTPIVVYCRSGNMSLEVSAKLIDLGYTNVKNLDGGIKAFNNLN